MINLVQNLIPFVEHMGQPHILLLGDLMIDEYIYGNAERLSPEAPVPVVHEKYRQHRAGGAGNVAADLATLGAYVHCISVRGNDTSGTLLTQLLTEMGVDTSGIVVVPERPTSTKTRLVGLAQHRHPQQMLRLDNETTAPITDSVVAQLMLRVRELLPQCQAVCIEDYNKGLLTVEFTQQVIALARQLNIPVLVDPAPITDYSKYHGATTITPNRTEAQRATGITLAEGIDNAPALAEQLTRTLDLKLCILTLDRHGMYRLEPPEAGVLHPTRPRNVYDVTGAGDMVLAMLAMVVAAGGNWSQAVDLANIAGGLEVEKFGCVPIKREEILRELTGMGTSGKIASVPEVVAKVQELRAAGKRIVFTNGVFDIMHAGHVRYLEFSRQQGDALIVGVNTDASVQRLKGPTRPVNPLEDRMTVLAGLASIELVCSFDTDTPADLIRAIQPDILVKGEDYAGKEVVGRDVVEARGGKVVLAPFLAGRSSSNVIAKIKDQSAGSK